MNVSPKLLLASAIVGFFLGLIAAFSELAARHKGKIMASAVASLVTACFLYGSVGVFPPLMYVFVKLSVEINVFAVPCFLAGWIIMLAGRNFWRELCAYANERARPGSEEDPLGRLPEE